MYSKSAHPRAPKPYKPHPQAPCILGVARSPPSPQTCRTTSNSSLIRRSSRPNRAAAQSTGGADRERPRNWGVPGSVGSAAEGAEGRRVRGSAGRAGVSAGGGTPDNL